MEVVESFQTVGNNTWELREDSNGNRYSVASNRTNKQPVASYQAAKASNKGRTQQLAKGINNPGEEPDYSSDFERTEINPENWNRTASYADILQLVRDVEVSLNAFLTNIDEYLNTMEQAHRELLEKAPEEYWTHATYGLDYEVRYNEPGGSIGKVNGSISTFDFHVENIAIGDFPEVYHPRHEPRISTDLIDEYEGEEQTVVAEPGLRERFIEIVESLNVESGEETIIKRVWIVLLKYSEDDNEANE